MFASLCPFNEFVDITIDGKPVERPETTWTFSGPNAYTFMPGDQPRDPTAEVSWEGDDPGVHR